ncbi:MAG: tRNA/rRNA methyltransferase SpoU [Parcubacteria group bacterium]|nr:tRNA/rRNA methyltransferase SpoU [Parcubacteria group bacterium]
MKTAVLILDNIRSVENTGSIFRTADCLGVSKIYLIGTTPAPLDRFGRKRPDFAKVALGAEESIEWEYAAEILPVIKELKSQNFKILALEQHENSKDLKDFKSPEMFALILGNEVEGVNTEALEKCDGILEIEMKGEKESLNVSVATGIAVFELLK